MTTSEVEGMLETVKEQGKLPAHVTGKTYDAMVESLTKYFDKAAADQITNFADKAAEIAEQALKTEQALRPQGTATVGMGTADSRVALTTFIEDAGESLLGKNVDFFLRVAGEVANGAGNFMAQNWDQERLDEFPALEFHRVYPRDIPRGSEEDKAGPENAWDDDEGRWVAACEEAEDDEALAAFEDTGRCVALKSSEVWEALGDGAGGYEDTLGNPFAPFAFNSGWDTDEINREEAIELGLMDEDDEVEGADIDFADLIGLDFRRAA